MSDDIEIAARLINGISTFGLIINITGIIIGIIGGIFNIITFTSPKLRSNATVFYLLCATLFQILCFVFPIPTRIALDNFNNNLERESIVFCKIRYYLSLLWPQLVTYYMLLATADRYFATSTSAQIRSWSNIRIAIRLSAIVLIGSHLATSHTLVFYTIFNNNCQVPPGTVYTIFFSVYLIVIVSVLPHILMLTFSILTFDNFRKMKQQIKPLSSTTTSNRSHRMKRFETQLMTTIAIQVVLNTILVLLRLGSYTYSIITSSQTDKTVISHAIEIFTVRLGIILYYFSFALSFYVSTLTSRCFRDVFCKRMIDLYRWISRMHR